MAERQGASAGRPVSRGGVIPSSDPQAAPSPAGGSNNHAVLFRAGRFIEESVGAEIGIANCTVKREQFEAAWRRLERKVETALEYKLRGKQQAAGAASPSQRG